LKRARDECPLRRAPSVVFPELRERAWSTNIT
jgi:hypothetical protein